MGDQGKRIHWPVPTVPAASIDLSRFVRPGDTVLWGQGAGEPLSLTGALAEQAERLGGVVGFVGLTYNPRLAAPGLRLRSYGALGAAADMPLEVITCHMSALPKLLRSGRLRADVVLCQLSPADADGNHSLGVTVDYLASALDAARVVLGEVNPAVPRTRGSPPVPPSRLAATVTADHCLIQIPDPEPDPVTAQIGAQVAELVPDGATVQLGIGGLASAVATALRGHRNLRVHSGLVGDWVVGLAESGALAREPGGPAVVTGTAVGTDRLYEFLRDNPAVEVRPVERVHDPAVAGGIARFVAVNSALQVDLSGQVNAEAIGGRRRGAIGGQVDFLRAAAMSAGGVGVVTLPSTANRGSVSRIVDRVDGPVTTGRADVHWVVTEYGAADLRGLDTVARTAALRELAHPDHRARLGAAAAHGG